MTTPATGSALPWPPPALEPIHGKLWPAIAIIGLADTVLGLPLVVSLATHQPIGSLGPFGDAFWIPLATTVIGSLALLAGLQRLLAIAWTARDAGRHGHGWRMIAEVAADELRDTGFLLVGARSFAGIRAAERDLVRAARLASAGLFLAAVLLTPLALATAIAFGRLGWVGPSFVWIAVSAIPSVLIAGGILSAVVARLLVRSARKGAPRRRTIDPALEQQVAQWGEHLGALRGGEPIAGGAPAPPALGLGAVGVIVLTGAAIVPVGLLTLAGTVGSILATVAAPRLGAAQSRIVATEAMRRYRLPSDPAVSARAAGEALHALALVGRNEAERPIGERAPARRYDDPWWPRDPGAAAMGEAPGWIDSLFGRRIPADQLSYLRTVASHPAHQEFAVVARAAAADVIGTRYELPLPPSPQPIPLPIPRFGILREGARAHVARAALELAEGRADLAEQTIRQVLSAGFLLIDHGPMLIDDLIGAVMVGIGGDALEALYRATGRRGDGETLAWVRAAVRAVAERGAVGSPVSAAEISLRAMPAAVADTTLTPGLRWELFGIVAALAPCANLASIAFGPGEEYQAWLKQARASLVRGPAEAAYFELLRRGPFGTGGCLPILGGVRLARELN